MDTRETITRGFTIPVVFTLDANDPNVQRWLATPQVEQQALLRRIVAGAIQAASAGGDAAGAFFRIHVPDHAFAPAWDDPLESWAVLPDDPTPTPEA